MHQIEIAARPTHALAKPGGQIFRLLLPGHRIRNKFDPVAGFQDPERKLGVFRQRFFIPSAYFVQDLFANRQNWCPARSPL